MRITKIELVNFKRFSRLEVNNIPESSKLVVIIGSNGSGKSSLFDAFGFVNSSAKGDLIFPKDITLAGDLVLAKDVFQARELLRYFKKDDLAPTSATISLHGEDELPFLVSDDDNTQNSNASERSFYGRSSFRQVSRLTRTALGQGSQFDFEKDSDRPKYFIDRDNRFENDIEKITETILKEFFLSGRASEEIKQEYISPINEALENIFGEGNGTKLHLLEIIPPLEGKVAQITFRKGESEIHYDYLSAGEKEVFNLLVNLLSRRSLYRDTIYYLDEIDLHLNTKLQYNLLKEITENWIPENCQLWTATHSLGFIEYARQSDHASILDFDDLNFDLPQTLVPEPKDNPEVYEIAVGKDFLPSLFHNMTVCFVENKDRDYYASVGVSNTVFVSDNDRNNVYHKVRTTNFKGIVDRDFLSDDDIEEITKQYQNLSILNYYSIENYMYHPDNLEEYYRSVDTSLDKQEYIRQLTEAKNQVKDKIMLKISISRTGYPYFGEPEFNSKPLQNRFKNRQENMDQSVTIQEYLNSDELEIFYQSLPMKDYCKSLPQRQNIPKSELVKTEWFKSQIIAIVL